LLGNHFFKKNHYKIPEFLKEVNFNNN